MKLKIKCLECGETKSEGIGTWRQLYVAGSMSRVISAVLVACRACGIYRVASAAKLKQEEANG